MIRAVRWIVSAAVLGLLLIAAAPSAAADPVTQTVQGEYLRIVSRTDWGAAASMTPQASVRWDLEISAQAPSPGRFRIGVSATGDAPVVVDVRLCGLAWQGDACAGGGRTLRAEWAIPRDGRTVELAVLPSDMVAHLRMDVRMAGAADAPPRGTTHVLVHADGFGDSVQTASPQDLPATGGVVPVAAIAAAGALLAAAVVLLLRARRRRGEDDG